MLRAIAVPLALLFATMGCSRTYQFELEVQVTSTTDHSPIEGAAIHRNMWGEKTDPKTPETVIHTDSAGRAAEAFSVTDGAFRAGKPTWYLRVFKDGFEPEIVEIKPAKPPAGPLTRLDIPIKLRPVKP
jgi:hypothetical protein